jgi:glyoxylase-like metal-dependent hydrolase (beta-lactamase superfamily II)
VSVEVTTFVNGRWKQNCYIVSNSDGDALIIDPGSQASGIISLVDERGWRVHGIVNSHAHYDHIGAVEEVKERYAAPFYLHAADEPLLMRANLYRMLFEANEAVRVPKITHDISALPQQFVVGPFALSWIGTPGHTEGSVCLLIEDYLFSGDTLMRNAVGRTDLPGGNREQLLASVRSLMSLPGKTVVCGGHGPRTTLQEEFSPASRVWSLLQ